MRINRPLLHRQCGRRIVMGLTLVVIHVFVVVSFLCLGGIVGVVYGNIHYAFLSKHGYSLWIVATADTIIRTAAIAGMGRLGISVWDALEGFALRMGLINAKDLSAFSEILRTLGDGRWASVAFVVLVGLIFHFAGVVVKKR